jgi:hypothetical protein
MPFAQLYFGAYGNLGLLFITKLGFILTEMVAYSENSQETEVHFQGGNDDTYRSIYQHCAPGDQSAQCYPMGVNLSKSLSMMILGEGMPDSYVLAPATPSTLSGDSMVDVASPINNNNVNQ